jgi:hypothetical protein
MSKALETLLEEIAKHKYNSRGSLWAAYLALMEERKTMPQAGQEIEVSDLRVNWHVRKLIGFASAGMVVVTEDKNGSITLWKHYRIPVPKKKWKVVIGANGLPFNIPEEDYIAGDIITTFEY